MKFTWLYKSSLYLMIHDFNKKKKKTFDVINFSCILLKLVALCVRV